MINNKRGSVWIWVLIIVILIVISVVVYFLLSGDVNTVVSNNNIPQPPAFPIE